MTSEQEKMLFEFLETIGFASEQLRERIRAKANLGVGGFSETETHWFGDEQMRYQLNFARDPQFQTYRLTDFDAIYREPILIRHAIINGIDTARLEEQMRSIDWATAATIANPEIAQPYNRNAETILDVISQVWKLSDNGNGQGEEIQKQLRIKYWLDTPFDSSAELQQLGQQYEVRKNFSVREMQTYHANLAYHILSGRLDDLEEIVRMTGAENYFLTSFDTRITSAISSNLDTFQIEAHRNNPDAYVELVMPVSKTEGWYSVDEFTLSVTPHPLIEHATFNGVNSEDLEAKMCEIDWHDDGQLFLFQEIGVPAFLPEVDEVVSLMYRLGKDPEGVKVAQALQVKYWADASFLDYLIEQPAWEYLESLPKRIHTFPAELEVKSAVNLLLGRPVMDKFLNEVEAQSDNWMRLDINKPAGSNGYDLIRLKGPTNEEVASLLKLVPLDTPYRPHYRKLTEGDALIRRLANGRYVKLELNLEQKSLNVYTPDGKLIPVNLQFDPSWKPGIEKELKQQISEQKSRGRLPSKIRKGKGI